MNERIEQLAEQAGFYGDPLFENLETFAELIIKDCANVVFTKVGPKTALDVLTHFGIEEE